MSLTSLQMPIPHRLVGKRAVITGGANGIGLATARRFLEEGAQVAIVDLKQSAIDKALKSLQPAIRQCAKLNVNSVAALNLAIGIEADVSDESSVKNMVSELHQWAHDNLSIAVLNAGIAHRLKKITDTDAEVFDRVMAVNCRGRKCNLAN